MFVADGAGAGAGGELPGAQAVGMQTVRVQADSVDHATYGTVGPWTGPTIDSIHDLPSVLPRS